MSMTAEEVRKALENLGKPHQFGQYLRESDGHHTPSDVLLAFLAERELARMEREEPIVLKNCKVIYDDGSMPPHKPQEFNP